VADPLVQVRQVTKNFGGLRPLRLQTLDLHAGEVLSLLGFDQAMAEVLVNLLTGAILPDSGTVTVLGTPTTTITTAEAWVDTLDHFGLISERAVLLDELAAEQNLALPISLQVDTMPDAVRLRVRALADEIGLAPTDLGTRLADLDPLNRQRIRLGRALALNPRVLLAEHPNAPLSAGDTLAFAADLARVAAGRTLALLVLTANREFAAAIPGQVLALQPATGELKPAAGWRRWFS
jgi:ABC-type sugar transport system ATPase subunit